MPSLGPVDLDEQGMTRLLAYIANPAAAAGQLPAAAAQQAPGGAPEPLNVAAEDAIFPAIASKADRLAYVHAHSDPNIWRVAGPAWKGRRPAPLKLIASSRYDSGARFAPDGNRIAFASDRSGSTEI